MEWQAVREGEGFASKALILSRAMTRWQLTDSTSRDQSALVNVTEYWVFSQLMVSTPPATTAQVEGTARNTREAMMTTLSIRRGSPT